MDGKLMKTAIAAALVAAFCCSASPAASQSLGDVAKKEEARRSAVRAASKKVTNADLGADPREASATATTGQAPAESMAAVAPGTASADGQAAAEPAVAAPKEDVQPEAWWRTRAQSVRARIANMRKGVEDLTGPPSENALQRAKVEKRLKSAQEALARAETDLHTLEMHADVAGIPKDWIR